MPTARHVLELGPVVSVNDIDKALRARRAELARLSSDPNALRVCTLNLVAFCHDENRCDDTHEVLNAMVVEHPGRLFLVHAHSEEPDASLQARVAVDGTPMGPGVAPTYAELIDLKATGGDVEFLPSLLTSLLESDQPACAWWATPPAFGPAWQRMAGVCDRMVVDSAQLDPWDLMRLVEYVRSEVGQSRGDRAALGDLSWARLKPFMSLVARFFEAPQVRERFERFTRVTIRHVPPAGQETAVGAAMLGAWVRERLHAAARQARVKISPRVELVKVARADLAPGDVAELVLSSGDGAAPMELAVTRPEGSTALTAEARQGIDGLPTQRLRLKNGSRSWLLAQELQIFGRDPLYESALLGAVDLLRESRR